MRIREFLRDVAPDFMWCSVFDLYLMYEQIDEDVEWHTFRQSFYQLKNKYFDYDNKRYKRKNNTFQNGKIKA